MPSCIIPAYNYPSPATTWSAWIGGAPVVRFMIGDPGDPGGPGVSADANYTAAFAAASAAGVTILGYVDTNYTAVSAATAEGQVDAWFTLYGVRDIFFDRASSSAADAAYYQALCDYAHTAGANTVMLNQGTNPDEAYYNGMAEILCAFEGSQADFDAYTPSRFYQRYPQSMTAVLIYSVTTIGAVEANATRAYAFGAGYVYQTDDTLADFPWDDLPTYWSGEVDALTDQPGGGGRH